MTLRTGESYVVETLGQFRRRLNVDLDEIANALPDRFRERALEEENGLRDEEGESPTQDITEIREDVLWWIIDERGENLIIQDVLDARDREYTHVKDISIHRIIELYPLEDEQPPQADGTTVGA